MAAKNGNGHADDDSTIEQIASEVEDQQSSPAAYDINTYYVDFTLEHYVAKLRDKDKNKIVIPEFQRKYVWKQPQVSAGTENQPGLGE